MNREQALDIVLKNSKPYDIFVGTTGFLSRELEDLRINNNYESLNQNLNNQY